MFAVSALSRVRGAKLNAGAQDPSTEPVVTDEAGQNQEIEVIPPPPAPDASVQPQTRWPAKGEPYRFVDGRPVPVAEIPLSEAQIAARAQAKPPSQEGRLTKRIKAAIEHIARNGLSQEKAADLAGCSRSGLWDALQRPSGRAYMEDRIKANLLVAAARASHTVETLMTSAKSEYVRLEAARTALDKAGFGVEANKAAVGDVHFNIDLSFAPRG